MENKKLLLVLHSINATGWLIVGTLTALLSSNEIGGWIILAALAAKIILFCWSLAIDESLRKNTTSNKNPKLPGSDLN